MMSWVEARDRLRKERHKPINPSKLFGPLMLDGVHSKHSETDRREEKQHFRKTALANTTRMSWFQMSGLKCFVVKILSENEIHWSLWRQFASDALKRNEPPKMLLRLHEGSTKGWCTDALQRWRGISSLCDHIYFFCTHTRGSSKD